MAKPARGLEVALTLALLLPGAANAQPEPGVIRDPDSPAGKEYALPLDAGRRLGAGNDAPEREGTAPLFGIGIGPPGAGDPSGGVADPRGDRSADSGGRDASGTARDDVLAPAAGDIDGGGTSGVTLAILAAVLLGGGLLGAVLRIAGRSRVGTA